MKRLGHETSGCRSTAVFIAWGCSILVAALSARAGSMFSAVSSGTYDDVAINQSGTTNGGANNVYLYAGDCQAAPGNDQRAFLAFDLTTVHSPITSATIHMYYNRTGSGNYIYGAATLYRVSLDGSPGFQYAEPVGSSVTLMSDFGGTEPASGWYSVNILGLISNGVTNYLNIRSSEGFSCTGKRFDSSEGGNPPSLTIMTADSSSSGCSLELMPVVDGQVRSSADSYAKNFSGTTMNAGNASASAGHDDRVFMKFDLSALPAGAIVTNAQLITHLEARSQYGHAALCRINSAWSTSDSGNTIYNLDVTGLGITFAPGDWPAITWYTNNVTATVSNWVAGTLPNHGLSLRGNEGFTLTSRTFDTTEEGFQVPTLKIDYRLAIRGTTYAFR